MTQSKWMRPGLEFAMGKAVEEAGEFLAAMGKTMRWGWLSVNPTIPVAEQETNYAWVLREMSDLRGSLNNLEAEMRKHAVAEGWRASELLAWAKVEEEQT